MSDHLVFGVPVSFHEVCVCRKPDRGSSYGDEYDQGRFIVTRREIGCELGKVILTDAALSVRRRLKQPEMSKNRWRTGSREKVMKDDSLAMMANVDGKTTRHCIGYKCSPSAAVQKAENMISRDFSAEAPNWKWLTDITQIPSDGKLYIAPVLDCFNGEIVGLAMDGNMKKELCIRAFDSACRSRNARGMILYSDRGRVYQLWIPEMQSFVVPKTDIQSSWYFSYFVYATEPFFR